MHEDETKFYVSVVKPPYSVTARKSYTFDDIWNSEKCWFMKGDRVLIRDSNGNTKEFIKE